MATKYWVGGTGTWDATTRTNWADSSGGAGGAIAPCALDDVVFDSASNATAYTVTISTNAVCRDLTIAGPASGNVTVAGSAALNIYGSLTLPATGITRTYNGLITFRATSSKTITTNGVTLTSNIAVNGTGGTLTLGSALTCGSITVTDGTFDTASYNLTAGGLTIDGSLVLGASIITLTGGIFFGASSTLNAGTSSITTSATNIQIGNAARSAGRTLYNLTFSSSTPSAIAIFAAHTYNNLTFTTLTSTATVGISLYADQTVNGTLTVSGQNAISRYAFTGTQSNSGGPDTFATRTLTVNAASSLTDVDFAHITVAGASSPLSGTRLGDATGNTNITFPAAKTVYWNLAAGGAWTATAWATSSGGAVAQTNFPLAQDTAIIENTGLNTSASITGGGNAFVAVLNCGTRTNAALVSITLRTTGNVTAGSGTDVTNSLITVVGTANQTLTSAGKTWNTLTVNKLSGTLTLADAIIASSQIRVSSGTFDTANFNVTISGAFDLGNTTSSKTITLGSSTVSTVSGMFQSTTGSTNLTLNAGTSSITASGTTASFGVTGLNITFYNLTSSSATAAKAFYGNVTCNNLTLTAATTVGLTNVQLLGNLTVNGTLNFGGGAAITQRAFVFSDTVGAARTITAAAVSNVTNINFRDITAAGAAAPFTGTSVGVCGGCTNITGDAAKTVYWNLAGTQNWTATGWATSSGGAPAAGNYPLPQDTCVFDDTGAAGTVTLNVTAQIFTLSMGNRTSAMTFAFGSSSLQAYGNVTLGTGVTHTGTGSIVFSGYSNQTFVSAGKTLSQAISTVNLNGTLTLGDALIVTGNFSHGAGIFDTQNYAVTASGIQSSGATTRELKFGSSVITLSGTGPITAATSTNLTVTAGTSTINLTSASAKTFAGGGMTYYIVSNNGAGALTITGDNTFDTLANTSYAALTLPSGGTQYVTNFNYTGAVGNVVNLTASTPGLQATIQKPSGSWSAGANSVDGGNNTGWTF